MKLFGKFDIILYLIIFTLLFGLVFFRNNPGDIKVYIDGNLYMVISLTKDDIYHVEDFLSFEVNNSKVRVIESTCPDKLCVKTGWINTPGIPIVCVPNKTMIIIESKDSEMDLITQ